MNENKPVTPHQRASIIFENYRSDDKSRWEPAFDAVVNLIEALEKIRNTDYRGNRHESHFIAKKALEELE